MYTKRTYRIKNELEHSYTYAGNYGAKGEKRAKRKKATPEQIAKQNLRNKCRNLRRLIYANFNNGDYWLTLKYPAGTRKAIDEVKKDFKKFKDRMRAKFKKLGEQFKFISRIEIGSQGGIHIHMVCNRIKGHDTDIIISDCWTFGNVHFSTLKEAGGYKQLAEYICKIGKNEEEYKQMMLFDEEERKSLTSISTSRNLIRPVPEVKEYFRRTMEKILTCGIVPTEGYYIDQDTIECGVNPYTGMSYLRYTEIRLDSYRGRSYLKNYKL